MIKYRSYVRHVLDILTQINLLAGKMVHKYIFDSLGVVWGLWAAI